MQMHINPSPSDNDYGVNRDEPATKRHRCNVSERLTHSEVHKTDVIAEELGIQRPPI
jgi:hypothetical protein